MVLIVRVSCFTDVTEPTHAVAVNHTNAPTDCAFLTHPQPHLLVLDVIALLNVKLLQNLLNAGAA